MGGVWLSVGVRSFFEFDHQVHFEQGAATDQSDRGGYLRSLIGWRMSQKILNLP